MKADYSYILNDSLVRIALATFATASFAVACYFLQEYLNGGSKPSVTLRQYFGDDKPHG